MSIRLMTSVLDGGALDLTLAQRFLLVIMADFADEDGTCWPKVQTLAARLNVEVRQTQKHLATLQKKGYLEVVKKSKGHSPNVYRVRGVENDRCLNGQVSKTTGVREDTPRPVREDTPPNLYNEPPIEPSIVPPTPKGKASRIRSLEWDQEFDIFWNLCPKKKSKEQARKAWHKMRRNKSCTMPPEEVAELYRKHYDSQRDAQYAQHPGTWLNAMGYEDEEPEQQQQPAATDPKGRPLPPGFTWDNDLYGIRNQFGYQVGEDMVEQEWRKLGNEEKAQKWVHVEPNWEMVP